MQTSVFIAYYLPATLNWSKMWKLFAGRRRQTFILLRGHAAPPEIRNPAFYNFITLGFSSDRPMSTQYYRRWR